MQFSIASARAAGFALLSACLVACADSSSVTAPAPAADASLRTVVTPLTLTPMAGTTLRTLVSVQNLGTGAATGVASVCVADAYTAGCGSAVTQLSLGSIAERDVHVDTASVALPLAPGAFVDVPQRVRVRACTTAAGAGAATCASSAVVSVMPNFEAACGVSPIAMGDSAVGTGDTGRCTLSSTGDRSQIFSVNVRGNDTLVVTLDAHGVCNAGLAVFDRTGEIVAATQACGPNAVIKAATVYGGTYHVAIGGVPAGYTLKAAYADASFAAADSIAP